MTFADWKRELVARLDAGEIPSGPQRVWRMYYRQGFTPETVAAIEIESKEIDDAMEGSDYD